MAIKGIIAQFAEESGFLWVIRNRVVDEPHFSLDDLARHDNRLEAHLDGLRVADEDGWDACGNNLGGEDPEGYFAPAVLAFESGMETRIRDVLKAIGENPAKARALISALGWIPRELAEPRIKNLLASTSPFQRYIGVAASAARRLDPGPLLDEALEDNNLILLARALRAYGELGRIIGLSDFHLQYMLSDDDDGIRFSSAWSSALTGNAEAVEVLKNFVTTDSPYNEKALNLALRRMDQAAALSWQRQLADSPDTTRLAIISAGIIGNPILAPWLIERMNTPALARVAGEAFTMITGADIEQEELRGKQPEGFNAGPNDDPKDDNVALDADDNLPWPNIESITRWWDKNKGAFQSGIRHLLGKPVSAAHLRQVLKTGLQRQRSAAALELAIIQPGQPLFNVRAPGFRQLMEVASV